MLHRMERPALIFGALMVLAAVALFASGWVTAPADDVEAATPDTTTETTTVRAAPRRVRETVDVSEDAAERSEGSETDVAVGVRAPLHGVVRQEVFSDTPKRDVQAEDLTVEYLFDRQLVRSFGVEEIDADYPLVTVTTSQVGRATELCAAVDRAARESTLRPWRQVVVESEDGTIMASRAPGQEFCESQ